MSLHTHLSYSFLWPLFCWLQVVSCLCLVLLFWTFIFLPRFLQLMYAYIPSAGRTCTRSSAPHSQSRQCRQCAHGTHMQNRHTFGWKAATINFISVDFKRFVSLWRHCVPVNSHDKSGYLRECCAEAWCAGHPRTLLETIGYDASPPAWILSQHLTKGLSCVVPTLTP